MTKFYNNVKSRLNKKGLTGFTKPDYLKAAEYLGVVDLDNVTTEQIKAGVEFLESRYGSQIEVVSKNVYTSKEISVNTPLIQQPSVHHQEIETFIEEEVSILTPVEEPIESSGDEDSEVSTMSTTDCVIALAEKTDLVTVTAHNMGIELQLNEVESIASNLGYSGDSLEEGIRDIESAITAFVEYKAQVNQEKINRMITQVRSTVSQRNEETSQRLNNGLNQIARDIQQGNTDFKSNIRSALKCFSIPTDQTG
ncbi:hypothetical protein LC609_32410 [Nostoc sp. XA013]|nr:hypothetical protein [Nostoc sp. XA013]